MIDLNPAPQEQQPRPSADQRAGAIELEHLRVLELRPDDVIVCTYPDELSTKQAAALETAIRLELPGHKVLILSGGLQLGSIRQALLEQGESEDEIHDRISERWTR